MEWQSTAGLPPPVPICTLGRRERDNMGKVSCLRKQHDCRDWTLNHQPSDLKSNALTTTSSPTKSWLNKTCLSTSGEANPFVPRGLSPASVYSSGTLFAESKSASLALEYSLVNNTFLAEKQMEKHCVNVLPMNNAQTMTKFTALPRKILANASHLLSLQWTNQTFSSGDLIKRLNYSASTSSTA